MTIVSILTDFAEHLGTRFAEISSKLLPAGGDNGQVLTKTASGEEWKVPLADFPFFMIQGSSGQGISQAFTTVVMSTVVSDTHNGWDSANNYYVVPQTGVYEIQVRLRLDDGFPFSVSCGLGVDLTNADTPGFIWSQTPSEASTTGASRYTMLLNRTVRVNAGDQLRLFAYWDSATPQALSGREMVIQRIR